MKNKRVIMYDVSGNNPVFYSATKLPTEIKDASAFVYNATITSFPDIDTKNLNIMVHGNNITSCVVKMEKGIIVSVKPLISSICEDIELYPNGNVLYRGICIIRFGDAGSKDKYGYTIAYTGKKDNFRCFPSAEDACDFIDKMM